MAPPYTPPASYPDTYHREIHKYTENRGVIVDPLNILGVKMEFLESK